MKKLLLLPALLLTLSVGNVACSYHNDDNPNEYPDPQPEPEPEPEPQPDVNEKYLEASYLSLIHIWTTWRKYRSITDRRVTFSSRPRISGPREPSTSCLLYTSP